MIVEVYVISPKIDDPPRIMIPQMARVFAMFQHLRRHGVTMVPRHALHEALDSDPRCRERFMTRQLASRVVRYYAAALIREGYLRRDVANVVIPAGLLTTGTLIGEAE